MISVIIPAHNEEAVINRGLRDIVNGAEPGELEVIVACNGCTDRTAEIARSFGPPVQVLDLPVASKIAALNAADEVATGFPRYYVDADVILDIHSIRRMSAVLDQGKVHFATPSLRMDMSHSSWPVRGYYRVWTQLPYNRVGGQVGTGVYALSQVGRARFDKFPEVVNDDGFVRFSFAAHERTTVSDAIARVQPPRSLAALLRAKTRVRMGHTQLVQLYPGRLHHDRVATGSVPGWVLRHPEMWLSLFPYVVVNLAARRRAFEQRRSGSVEWGRDDSRTTVGASVQDS